MRRRKVMMEYDLDLDMELFPPLKISRDNKTYDYMAYRAVYLEDGTVRIEYKKLPYFMLN